MSPEVFAATVATVGLVIVVSTLFSGAIEKTGLPHVAVFLLMGAVLGPSGVAVLDARLDSPLLRIVATLSLALVLFLDAITLDTSELRRHVVLAARVLGPGTLLSAGLTAALAHVLLGLSWPAATILGAALASTDPVLLRGLTRRPDLGPATRMALRLESGLNDVVLLPIVLIAISLLSADPAARQPIGKLALSILVVGPLAGAAVGFFAVSALTWVRKHFGIRRDYESIFSLGVCFTAFAVAESFHGSGFLAAFAAGLVIVLVDVELCDCFIEYGETTAEMLLLFTFVLFGASAIWTGLDVVSWRTLLFAVLVLLLRPVVFIPSLAGAGLDRRGRLIIGWFGPRGLSSLLLVLLAVFAGVAGAVELFQICSLVVLASVVVHGGSLIALRRKAPLPAASKPAPTAAEPAKPLAPIRISVDEAANTRGATFVDVRTERSSRESTEQIAGALRIDPASDVVAQARALGLAEDTTIILYCA